MKPAMKSAQPRIVIIMANLGTPDAPTPQAVRAFLRQFLSDQRVIEIPKLLWQIILNLFILPIRPKAVAKNYASIWQDDSPMRKILNEQVRLVEQRLLLQNPDLNLQVIPAMTYGQPSIHKVLAQLSDDMPDQVILFPLFPQYSATSSAPLYDVLSQWVLKQRNLPALSIVRDYYQHPDYIQSLVQSVRDFQTEHGQVEKLLMSFHGIPQPYADKGDPYADRCRETARLVAEQLGLSNDQWAISFQSRFGKQEWVKPYTSELLKECASQGVKSVQVMSPAFSADCLETLEELEVENRDIFIESGGQSYAYIPALNVRDDHIAVFTKLIQAQLNASREQLLR